MYKLFCHVLPAENICPVSSIET